MCEGERIIEVSVGSAMEYYKCAGDLVMARLILTPYDSDLPPKSPAIRLIEERERAAEIAERLKSVVVSSFARPPESLAPTR